MYSEFWSNKTQQASGNPADMLRELVRIGFEQAVARAEASARMARSLAGCRTPLDAISVYQDWMVNESQRVVADMSRMAELTRTLLQQSSDAAILSAPVEPPMPTDGGKAAAAAKGQSAPEPKPAPQPSPKAEGSGLPEAEAKPAAEPKAKADAKPEAGAASNEAGAGGASGKPAAGGGKKAPARKKQTTAAES
jgi:hypothetical protein